jgi:hypothetical protein
MLARLERSSTNPAGDLIEWTVGERNQIDNVGFTQSHKPTMTWDALYKQYKWLWINTY